MSAHTQIYKKGLRGMPAPHNAIRISSSDHGNQARVRVVVINRSSSDKVPQGILANAETKKLGAKTSFSNRG
jgi:hypothetical protein